MLRLTHGQMGIEPLCQKVLFVLIKKKKKKWYRCLLCFEMRLDPATFVQQVVISALRTFVFMISNLTITGQSHHVLDNGFRLWE